MLTGNTHFAIAVHLLTAMSFFPDRPVSSTQLATTVPTNPAFLRVVLSRLRDAGLVRTTRGHSGGNALARDPGEINLLQVFRAVEGEALLNTHDCSTSTCKLAARIPALLERLGQRVDAAVATELEAVTVAALAAEANPFGESLPDSSIAPRSGAFSA